MEVVEGEVKIHHAKDHTGNWDAGQLLADRVISRNIWSAIEGVDYYGDWNNWSSWIEFEHSNPPELGRRNIGLRKFRIVVNRNKSQSKAKIRLIQNKIPT